MNDTTWSASLDQLDQPMVFNLTRLYTYLQQIEDHRRRQGNQYPLAVVLLIGILAKIAGQGRTRGMALWAQLRTQELCRLFGLQRKRLPHASTLSRILGKAIDPEQGEAVIGAYFAEVLSAQSGADDVQAEHATGISLAIAIDGKILRGTIPLGKTRGVHLLALYLPHEGIVIAQVQVDGKKRRSVPLHRCSPASMCREGW